MEEQAYQFLLFIKQHLDSEEEEFDNVIVQSNSWFGVKLHAKEMSSCLSRIACSTSWYLELGGRICIGFNKKCDNISTV